MRLGVSKLNYSGSGWKWQNDREEHPARLGVEGLVLLSPPAARLPALSPQCRPDLQSQHATHHTPSRTITLTHSNMTHSIKGKALCINTFPIFPILCNGDVRETLYYSVGLPVYLPASLCHHEAALLGNASFLFMNNHM